MLPVLQKFTDRVHFARILRPFFSTVMMLALAACSRPASYEQFIKAENARDGVYEFAIPAIILTSASSVNTTAHPASAADAAPAPTFDISLYTAPLENALQLEVLWLELPSGDLSHFSPEMPQVPSENGGPGANMPQNAADTTKIDTTCSNNGVLCGRSAPGPRIIHEESVWFPAGEHRALYRSGVVFSGSGGQAADSALLRNPIRENASLAACPPESSLLRNPIRENASLAACPPDSSLLRNPIRENAPLAACPREEVILRIKVADPPEDFRGLGIICKRNDGTR